MIRGLRACLLAAACGHAVAMAAPAQAGDEAGRWQVAAEDRMVVVYERGVRVKAFAAASRDARVQSVAVAIHHLPARRSFVIAFQALAELWELSVDPQAAPIHDGLVHDYRLGEAVAEPGHLGIRRTRLEQPLHTLAFDTSGAFVLGRALDGADGRAQLHLVQLDIRRVIARFAIAGDPNLSQAQALQHDGRSVIRVPDRRGGAATLVDVRAARIAPAAD